MGYETESFTDIMRLTARTGKVPPEIPAHYWRFCWALRRKAMGNKVPAVSWRDAAIRSTVIHLKA